MVKGNTGVGQKEVTGFLLFLQVANKRWVSDRSRSRQVVEADVSRWLKSMWV